jgi:hypothetical protein
MHPVRGSFVIELTGHPLRLLRAPQKCVILSSTNRKRRHPAPWPRDGDDNGTPQTRGATARLETLNISGSVNWYPQGYHVQTTPPHQNILSLSDGKP